MEENNKYPDQMENESEGRVMDADQNDYVQNDMYPNHDNQTGSYQNNGYPNHDNEAVGYQNDIYPNNDNRTVGYQNNTYQNNSSQNDVYQNNGYPNGAYQNSAYRNDAYQSDHYQDGAAYQSAPYQYGNYQNYGGGYQQYNGMQPYPDNQMELEEPVKVSEWVLALVLMMIPCVNIIMMFVWAFSKTEKKSKSNFFKAYLIFFGISMGVMMLIWIAIVIFALML